MSPRRGQLPMVGPGGGMATGRPPLRELVPSLVAAALAAAAALTWILAGQWLPGGRWLAVHLFTLGVLTNLVLAFSEHFGRTVTRTPGEAGPWWPAVTNAGVVAVLVGVPVGSAALLVLGASLVAWSVLASLVRLVRMRRASVGARFLWVARAYEHAHVAFVVGALLGVLLGAGWVPGAWYGGTRLAHLHANVLGWGGVTLLATLVFLGPTMARTEVAPGADVRAARALPIGAGGLALAVGALPAIGLAGWSGTLARGVAAAGLAGLAVTVTVVALPVLRVAIRARPAAPRWLVVGVAAWFPLIAWADVLVVAAGAWRWLDALGAGLIGGVLASAMLATVTHLGPVLVGRTPAARDRVRARLEVGAALRAAILHAGVVAAVVAAAPAGVPGAVGVLGWGVAGSAVAVTAASLLWPVSGRGARP